MADRTSITLQLRTSDAAHPAFQEFGEVRPMPTQPEISYCDVESGIPDFQSLVVTGVPFHGSHGSYSGSYCAYLFAFDGTTFLEHTTDDDGNLAIPGLLEWESEEPFPGESTRLFIQHYRKCKALVAAPPSPHLPDDFRLSSVPTEMVIHEMRVPEELITHALRFYGKPETRVIAQFYAGEEALFHLEDLVDDFDALLADGWPGRFLEAATDAAADGADYLRLIL